MSQQWAIDAVTRLLPGRALTLVYVVLLLIKMVTKSNLGRKGLISLCAYSPSRREARAGTEAEAMEECRVVGVPRPLCQRVQATRGGGTLQIDCAYPLGGCPAMGSLRTTL